MSKSDSDIAKKSSKPQSGDNNRSSQLSLPSQSEALAILDLQEKHFDEFSDCEIHIHSEVFRAYFNNNSLERQTRIIRIDDLEANLIREALRFMYSGSVKDLNSICHDLYVVADRYDIKLLKSKCLNAMFDNLNIDSVVKCLEIAFQLEVPEFKEKIFKFTTDNNEVIMKSTQMKELIKNNDIVSSALFLYMANQLKKRDEQLQKIESDNSNVSLKTGSLVQELDHDNRSEISQTVSSYQHRLDSLQAELQEALNGDIMRKVARFGYPLHISLRGGFGRRGRGELFDRREVNNREGFVDEEVNRGIFAVRGRGNGAERFLGRGRGHAEF